MATVFYEERFEDTYIGPICKTEYPVHIHDVVEIVCLTTGTVEMTIGEMNYTLGAGDIAVVFPSVAHGYTYVSSDAEGIMMVFTPNTISEFTQLLRTMVLLKPVLRHDDKDPALDKIVALMQSIQFEDHANLKQGYLHVFLVHLFPVLTIKPAKKHADNDFSARVISYIAEHFTETLSLSIIAKALNVSRTHLSHLFSQQLKINFCQYINTLRVDYACQLLRSTNYPVAQIVTMCGYANTRTFHRAFIRQKQMTPKQYKSSLKKPTKGKK